MASRRSYGGISSGRRPRTKLYDCNYSMGERYYKPTLDQLDRKQFGRVLNEEPPKEEIRESPRPRPASMADLDSVWDTARAKEAKFAEEADKEMDDILQRVRAARQSTMPTVPEQSFDTALNLRSEETKRRFAEKMLDSVGINGEAEDTRRTIRTQAFRMEDPKWPALPETGESAAELAAKARARATRARLADLDSEMVELSERSVARDRRAAALRQMLSDESDSYRLSKKVTITEKRTSAY